MLRLFLLLLFLLLLLLLHRSPSGKRTKASIAKKADRCHLRPPGQGKAERSPDQPARGCPEREMRVGTEPMLRKPRKSREKRHDTGGIRWGPRLGSNKYEGLALSYRPKALRSTWERKDPKKKANFKTQNLPLSSHDRQTSGATPSVTLKATGVVQVVICKNQGIYAQ